MCWKCLLSLNDNTCWKIPQGPIVWSCDIHNICRNLAAVWRILHHCALQACFELPTRRAPTPSECTTVALLELRPRELVDMGIHLKRLMGVILLRWKQASLLYIVELCQTRRVWISQPAKKNGRSVEGREE